MKLLPTLMSTLMLLFTFQVNASISPYLPLKTSNLIELEIERLATLAKMPILTKPYHAKTVLKYLQKIKISHPSLYYRINRYLRRHEQTGKPQISIQASENNDSDLVISNDRGNRLESHYKISVDGHYQINSAMIVNYGGTAYEDEDFIPHNTYLSFGWDVFQVDIGYREHWLSPHHEGALLVSTQAKPALNVTVSNPELLTDWNIKYEMSVGLLEEQDNIKFGTDEPVSGEPGFLTMHASIQPLDFWTLGFNRTFMFSGGSGSISISDVWDAIIDPVNNDNCGGSGTELQDCSEEFGNQQASITNKLDLVWFDLPFSFYHEFAGEDTKSYKNTSLGNLAVNYGLFFPYLRPGVSMNLEHTTFQSAWYVHHIYGEGYTNDGNIMGHWWGEKKRHDDSSGGNAQSVKLTWENDSASVISMVYRSADIESGKYNDYKRSHELELSLDTVVKDAFMGFKFHYGKTNFGDNLFQGSIYYRW